jgi:hypothetical protein
VLMLCSESSDHSIFAHAGNKKQLWKSWCAVEEGVDFWWSACRLLQNCGQQTSRYVALSILSVVYLVTRFPTAILPSSFRTQMRSRFSFQCLKMPLGVFLEYSQQQ